jgi:hypothetical protein
VIGVTGSRTAPRSSFADRDEPVAPGAPDRPEGAGAKVTDRRGHMPGFRFGKHPPKHDYRTLRFKNYLVPGIAAPPAQFNVLERVFDNLHANDPTKLFPMDGNDRYGDCTIAALAHAITVFRGLGPRETRIMAQQAVLKLYMKLTGGIDSGLNELDVLNYWRKTAVDGDKILAFAKIDPKKDFRDKKPWTPGPLTQDGHAVYAVGYDPNMVTVLTWGNTQQGSWAWWDECVDEAYALLPAEAKNANFAPGFNFAQLQADLNAVAD